MNLTVGLPGSGANRIVYGTAEDEITRAAADVGASGGGTVTVLQGVYDLASGVVIRDDNVQLRGAGVGQTILRAKSDFQLITYGMIAIHGADRFTVSGITVDATRVPSLNGAAATNGITALQSTNGTISNCQVLLSANWSYGIWARQSDSIRIVDNEVNGGVQTRGQEGIEVFDADNITISSNVVRNIGSSGIALFFLPDQYWEAANVNRNIRVTDNYVENALIGVHVMVAGERTLDGVQIHRNALNDVGANLNGDLGSGIILNNFPDPDWGNPATPSNPQRISNITATYNFINLSADRIAEFEPTSLVLRTSEEALISGVRLTPNTPVNKIVDGSNSGNLAGTSAVDLITFHSARGNVSIDLKVASLVVNGVTGRASGFEHVVGSDYNDIIVGNDGANIIDGAAGIDTVAYYAARSGVTLDLNAGYARVGTITDTLLSIENAVGSPFNDTMYGTAGANTLQGRGERDSIYGRDGNDTLINGAGVNGAAGSVMDGGLGNDIVRLLGSQAYTSDYVTLIGGEGNDRIEAGVQFEEYVGSIKIDAGSGTDTIRIGHVEGSANGEGYVNGGAGDDVIQLLDTWGGVGIWSNSAFRFLGDSGNDRFDLAGTQLNVLGNNQGALLDGGSGFDTLRWNGSYNLTIGGHQNASVGLLVGYAQELNIRNIEKIDLASTGARGLTLVFTANDIAAITAGSDFNRSALGHGLTGSGNALFIDDGPNNVSLAGWTLLGPSSVLGQNYALYASGGALMGLLV